MPILPRFEFQCPVCGVNSVSEFLPSGWVQTDGEVFDSGVCAGAWLEQQWVKEPTE